MVLNLGLVCSFDVLAQLHSLVELVAFHLFGCSFFEIDLFGYL